MTSHLEMNPTLTAVMLYLDAKAATGVCYEPQLLVDGHGAYALIIPLLNKKTWDTMLKGEMNRLLHIYDVEFVADLVFDRTTSLLPGGAAQQNIHIYGSQLPGPYAKIWIRAREGDVIP